MNLITHQPTGLKVDPTRRQLFRPEGSKRAPIYVTADGVEVVMVVASREEGTLWPVERILQELPEVSA